MDAYSFTGALDVFEFHDAVLEQIELSPARMTWRLRAANLTARCPLLCAPCDQEIASLRLTFEGWRVLSLSRQGYLVTEAGGQTRAVPDTPLPPEYLSALAHSGFPWDFKEAGPLPGFPADRAFFFLFFGSESELYRLDLSYERVTAAWDGYAGNAWYVGWNAQDRGS